MALDLTMKIVADASQAKAELRQVEQSIQRVETASAKTSPAIEKIGTTIGTHKRSLDEWDERIAQIEANTARLSGTASTASGSLSGLGGAARTFASTLSGSGGVAEGASLSSAALMGIAGAAVASAAALGGFIAFLVSSTREYASHADAAKGIRDALTGIGEAWHDVQMEVGQAVIGGSEDSIATALRIVGNLWTWIGDQTARAIIAAKEYSGLSVTPGGGRNFMGTRLYGYEQGFFDWLGGFAEPASMLASGKFAPATADAMYGALPLGVRSPYAGVAGMGVWQGGLAGSQAEAPTNQWLQDRKREQEAERRAADLAEKKADLLQKQIQQLLDYGVPFKEGLPTGRFPGAVDLSAVGLTYATVPGLPQYLGLSSAPGERFPITIPEAPTPSFGSTLLANLYGDVSNQIFRMIGRGSNTIGGQVGGSIAGSIGSSFGTKIGGFFGTALGPLGAIGGSLLGSLFGGLFGETQGHKDLMAGNAQIADMKKQLLETYGSMENLQRLGLQFGIDWKAAWGSQNLAGAQHFRDLMDQMAAKAGELQDQIARTKQQIADLGGDGEVNWKKLEEAAARYGKTLDSLGGSFQTARMQDQWQQVIDDLDLFQRGGVSAGDALDVVSGKIDELVIQSLKFGTTIPENMRPWIQTLIDQGKLLDENGNKITDISKLSFGETMQTTLEKLNKTLEELVAKLSGDLPAAIDQANRGPGVTVPIHWKPDPFDPQRYIETPDPEQLQQNSAHTGGYITPWGVQAFHRGGEVFARLLPGEFVLQRSAVDRVGVSALRAINSGAATTGGTSTIILQADGLAFARIVAPHLPGEVRRYGIG